MCKTDSQWEFAERCRELKPDGLSQPRGLGRVGGGKQVQKEGTYLYLWLTHVDVQQILTQ